MAGYGVTTKHFRESESQAVGMAGDLRAGRQTHGSGPGWTAPAGAEGAETPGAVSGAEAELKRREKADAQGGRGRLKRRRAGARTNSRSRRAREVRTGKPPSRPPWRADAGEQGHGRGEGTQTARLGS